MHDVFFFTDTHGRKDLFDAMRTWCYEQDPECNIIFGGDAADRGPDGYSIMKILLNDPQVIYLKGNHEDMFVNAAKALRNWVDPFHRYTFAEAKELVTSLYLRDDDIYLSCANGGRSTLISYVMDGVPIEMIDRLSKLHTTFRYNNIDFCHAGYTPEGFEDMYEDEFAGVDPHNLFAENGIIWDREHLDEPWTEGRICIFGHTPVQYLRLPNHEIYPSDYRNKPAKWGNKIDMDTGMVFSNVGYVLNVHTMEMTQFESIKEE